MTNALLIQRGARSLGSFVIRQMLPVVLVGLILASSLQLVFMVLPMGLCLHVLLGTALHFLGLQRQMIAYYAHQATLAVPAELLPQKQAASSVLLALSVKVVKLVMCVESVNSNQIQVQPLSRHAPLHRLESSFRAKVVTLQSYVLLVHTVLLLELHHALSAM
jgi:hypothetical protein